MNKVILILAVVLVSLNVKAQSGISESQLDSIKREVQVLQSDLAECKSTIAKVAEQNLALKNALHLQPTLAESSTRDGLNFRLLGAKGNKMKGEVELDIEVMNTTRTDVSLSCNSFQIVDELGHVYTSNEISSQVGNSQTPIYSAGSIMPDTPVKMKVVILVPHECQYIKGFLGKRGWDDNFRFANIPINWTR